MKYINSEKLIAEIERRLKIVEPHKDTFESAAACRQELIWMKEFITSLQQEQPEVDFEVKFAEFLERKDAELGAKSWSEDDLRELALYFYYGMNDDKQSEVDLENEMEESEQSWYNKAAEFWYKHCELNKTKDQRILILDAPTFTEFVHDIYELGLNARKEE